LKGCFDTNHRSFGACADRDVAVERLTKHLQRRSQRAYRPPEGKTFYAHVQDLGLKRL
jgi:hypothetical protein